MGLGGAPAEASRNADVGDRGPYAGHGLQPRRQRRRDADAFAEFDVVVGAGGLVAGDHRCGSGVTLDRRVRP